MKTDLLFRSRLRTHTAVALLVLISMVGCGPSRADLESVSYTPTHRDDWKVSTPAGQGLNPMLVAELYCNAAKLQTIHSLLVIKNGYLVAENYFEGGAIDQKDRLQSATKSVTSALVGIALDRGLLLDVDQKMIDFFPEIAGQMTDPRKKQITIRHLLQMRGGYPSEESRPDLWKGLLSGHYPPLLEKFPLVNDPGARFHYSNLSSNWLGIIVDRASGMNLGAFAEKYLFSPLDIEAGEWGQDAEGHNNGCGDLHLTARDAAKFGLLYLNGGVVKQNQIVPASWVRESFKTHSVNEAFVKKIGHFHDIGYGYHWWSANVDEHHIHFAWGHGGQLIVLLEKLEMMVVTTSYPFWLEHNNKSWKHEKAIIKLVGTFIHSLPNA